VLFRDATGNEAMNLRLLVHNRQRFAETNE
jgi:hypothetical protein